MQLDCVVQRRGVGYGIVKDTSDNIWDCVFACFFGSLMDVLLLCPGFFIAAKPIGVKIISWTGICSRLGNGCSYFSSVTRALFSDVFVSERS